MKEIRLTSLSGALLFAALLNAQQRTVYYHTEASAAQTPQALPLAPQWPCTVSALNGAVTLDGQAIYKGDAVSSIEGLQFGSTQQVLVLTDCYQRNFYVTSRTHHFNDVGLPCGGPNVDCTPVVRDNMGTVVFVAPENRYYSGYDRYAGTTPKGELPSNDGYRPATYNTPEVVYPAPFVETTVATPAPTKIKYTLLMRKQ